MSETNSNFYSEASVEEVFQKLTSSHEELKKFYKNYAVEEYADGVFDDRMYYYDIARVAAFINKMFLNKQTADFPNLFKDIEQILTNSDQFIQNLMVVGLFEGMQNTPEINCYIDFNEWLQPESKKAWDDLIKFWEGENRDRNSKK
jgi:uncharacterized protein YabN with tetrapyrrole methylase and pyrophosphatase domain